MLISLASLSRLASLALVPVENSLDAVAGVLGIVRPLTLFFLAYPYSLANEADLLACLFRSSGHRAPSPPLDRNEGERGEPGEGGEGDQHSV